MTFLLVLLFTFLVGWLLGWVGCALMLGRRKYEQGYCAAAEVAVGIMSNTLERVQVIRTGSAPDVSKLRN